MKTLKLRYTIPLFLMLITAMLGFKKSPATTPYKCMIQMKNYTGEGAYVIISLLNPKGAYEATLYVQGADDEWYYDLTEWWGFYGKKRSNIDAITGETIRGGARTISILTIPDIALNTGYKIRVETAVEDDEYYKNDVEFELTTENIKNKIKGSGFIRYIRMMPN